jgi:hypothetical protein
MDNTVLPKRIICHFNHFMSLGCISVMLCSAVVHFFDADIGKLADPVFAIISAFSLIILTYPYSKYCVCLDVLSFIVK